MFNKKQTSLSKTVEQKAVTNPFVVEGLKSAAVTVSGNGAKKYDSHSDEFVTQFGTIAQYMAPRPYDQIDRDMRVLCINKELAIKFVFYIRMITRVVVLPDGNKTTDPQKGAGLKHEGITRMLWLSINEPTLFWENVALFISIGSWKDIVQMLSYDLQYNGWQDRKLNWPLFGKLILAGLENPNSSELVKKYLPQIKANSACKTLESQADNIISKWLCALLYGGKTDDNNYGNYKLYRKMKSSGTAHQWQQLISQNKHKLVDFNTIHGRALAKLVSGKYLKNQGLEDKYSQWIAKKPVAKFTGFVYELAATVNFRMQLYQKNTVNAQYQNLLELAMVNTANSPYRPIAVLDSSGSMSSTIYIGNGQLGKMSSIDMAFPLVLFLNDMLPQSMFKDNYLEFANVCKMHPIKGATFVDKLLTTPKAGYGGTNFMSVFDLFIQIKQNNPGIDENLIPNMIVCFSDGEFNNVGKDITNVEKGRAKLKQAGFSESFANTFGFVFVDIPNTFYNGRRAPKFETFDNVKNVFYFSGYDLSPLGFLFGQSNVKATGVPSTASELFMAAMQQEVLNLITIK